MTDIICAAIAGLCSIVVVVLTAKNTKRNKQAEEDERIRQEGNLLSLRMQDAILQLSVVSSNALTGGHNNGNVERAREAVIKVSDEYEEFMRNITARQISK